MQDGSCEVKKIQQVKQKVLPKQTLNIPRDLPEMIYNDYKINNCNNQNLDHYLAYDFEIRWSIMIRINDRFPSRSRYCSNHHSSKRRPVK